MKQRFLCLGLALLLLLGATLSSCKNFSISSVGGADAPSNESSESESTNDNKENGSGKDSTDPKDAPPQGYAFAEYGALRFVYPSNWVEDTESETPSYGHATQSSYLSVEASTDTELFQTMTAEEYEEQYGSPFAASLGGSVFGTTARRLTNKNNLNVALFSCFINIDELTIKQLLYAINIGELSYTLLVLLEETSEEMEQTFLDSMKEIPLPENFIANEIPPTGYRFHTRNDLRFVYPSFWHEKTLRNPSKNDYINIIEGYSAALYTEMTIAQFDAMIGDMMQESGFSTENVVIEKRQNANGISVNYISYSLKASDGTLHAQQHLFAFTLNRTAYAMILSLTTPDSVTAQTIFDSIKNVNPSDTSPAAGETKAYDHLNLRFSYPAVWGVEESFQQITFYQGTQSISISSSEKTTEFDDMTEETFQNEYVPALEQNLGATIYETSIKRFESSEGLTGRIFQYAFLYYGWNFQQIIYVVTVDQTTHTIVITASTEEEITSLSRMIAESITAIEGPNYGDN